MASSSVSSEDSVDTNSQRDLDLRKVLNESENHFKEFVAVWTRGETLDVSKKYHIEKTAESMEEYYLQQGKPEYVSTICTQLCKRADDANLSIGAKHYIMKVLKSKYKNVAQSKSHEHLRYQVVVPPQDVKTYGTYLQDLRNQLDNIDYGLMTRDMVSEHTEWSYDHEKKNTEVCDASAIAIMDRKPHNSLNENEKQNKKKTKTSVEKPPPSDDGAANAKMVVDEIDEVIETLKVLKQRVLDYYPINKADAARWAKSWRTFNWYIKPWTDNKYRRDVLSWVKICKTKIAAGGTHASKESGSPIPLLLNKETGAEELRVISKEHIDNRGPAILNGMVEFINYFPYLFECCMHYQASKMPWMDKRAHDVRDRMVESA